MPHTCTMATHPVGHGKAVVSASVPKDIADEIARRAELLGISKSRYAAMVLQRWHESGDPPVSEPDRLMRQSPAASEGRSPGSPSEQQPRARPSTGTRFGAGIRPPLPFIPSKQQHTAFD